MESGSFEPDTLFTLKRYISDRVVFFDVGAAAGVFTLIASKLGAKCLAYEPVPKFFTLLSENLDLNLEIKNKVLIKQSVVSNFSQPLTFLRDQVGQTVSSIVYPENFGEASNILDIKKEVLENCLNLKPIIKFDIEGAEYKILRDQAFLRILQEKRAIVILAIHPGFFRPIKKEKNIFSFKIAWIIFVLRNYIENYILFKTLSDFCTIKRSNEEEVSSALKFCTMSTAGVYEYNLYFF